MAVAVFEEGRLKRVLKVTETYAGRKRALFF
jgi:hypothetical protein